MCAKSARSQSLSACLPLVHAKTRQHHSRGSTVACAARPSLRMAHAMQGTLGKSSTSGNHKRIDRTFSRKLATTVPSSRRASRDAAARSRQADNEKRLCLCGDTRKAFSNPGSLWYSNRSLVEVEVLRQTYSIDKGNCWGERWKQESLQLKQLRVRQQQLRGQDWKYRRQLLQ